MAAVLKPVYVGADIGGTKTLVVACDPEPRELRRQGFLTPIELSAGLQQLTSAIESVADGARIAAIGVSIGGPVDRERGTVSPLHQPEWRNVPLQRFLSERFQCPCRIEVDTNAAALAEWYLGGVQDTPLVYLTLSTGIGGALITEGKLYRGTGGSHPELGHQIVPNEFGDNEPVPCTCGAFNCLEALVSGRALEKRFQCPPAQLSHENWECIGRILGHGLRNIALLYAPRRIVLGGGLATHASPHFLPAVHAILRQHVHLVPVPELSLSVLGYETAL
ncbi:MAG: ROK family protein, partial [Candidatus Kapabacteria bacterium]|nr:ROK family protein [Candidatus Kapabacteria bacterium]MDW7996255.1 ROK family protein [Bacteroidota bacterium]